MSRVRESAQEVAPRLVVAVTALVAIASLPLVLLFLSPWVSGFFALALVLRLLALRGLRKVSHWILLPLSLAATLLVLSQQHSLFGRDAGVSLLLLMLGLKLLELHSRRDLMVAIFMTFFLVASEFLFTQSIPITAFLLVLTLGLTALLCEIFRVEPSTSVLQPVRAALPMLLQAIPIMLVLFVLFPRISGPLWGLTGQSAGARSGFSDRISPGSISELVLSEEIAFRAEFAGTPPLPAQRYWRGLVFWDTDGKDWTHAWSETLDPVRLQYVASGNPLEYVVTIEPHFRRWMFALDLPASVPPSSGIQSDFSLRSKRPIRAPLRYRMRSHLDYNTGDLAPSERRRGLQLPGNVTARMRALALAWGQRAATPAEVVRAALEFFHQEDFVYTLLPPRLGANPADEFLFDTRRGFCEHFATSFTLMMRLAGIPSRVVTGYQGAEYNPHGGYYIVRQSDAHAWSEVWLEGQGWLRVDPTTAVAPERIERPIDLTLLGIGTPVGFQYQFSFLANLWHQGRLVVDALNMSWKRWVLDYDRANQAALLSRLGLSSLEQRGLGIAMVGAALAAVLLVALIQGRRRGARPPAVSRHYQRFCGKLRHRGLVKQASEAPRAYAQRICRARPQLSPEIWLITELYLRLRYGPDRPQAEKVRELGTMVRRFRA